MPNKTINKKCSVGDTYFIYTTTEWNVNTCQGVLVYLNKEFLIENIDYTLDTTNTKITLKDRQVTADGDFTVIFMYDVFGTSIIPGNVQLSSSNNIGTSNSKVITEEILNYSLNNLTNASLTVPGVVQLSNKYNGTSETVAVTEKALSNLVINRNNASLYIGYINTCIVGNESTILTDYSINTLKRTPTLNDVILIKDREEYWIYTTYTNVGGTQTSNWGFYAKGVNINEANIDSIQSNNLTSNNLTSTSSSGTTFNVTGNLISTKVNGSNLKVDGTITTENLILSSTNQLNITGNLTTGNIDTKEIKATTVNCDILNGGKSGLNISSGINCDNITSDTLTTDSATVTNLYINNDYGVAYISGELKATTVNCNTLASPAGTINTGTINLTQGGIFNIGGNLTANTITSDNSNITNLDSTNVTTTKLTTGNLVITNNTGTITGNFNVNKINVTGLTTTSSITTDDIIITGTQGLTINNNLNVSNNAIVGTMTATNVTVTNNLNLNNNDLTVNGTLNSNNIDCTTITGTTVNTDNFNLTNDNDVNITGAFTVSGNTTSNSLTTNTLTVPNNLTTTNLNANNMVFTNSTANISQLSIDNSNGVEINGNLTVNGSGTVNIRSLSSYEINTQSLNINGTDGLKINGNITANDITTTNFKVLNDNGLTINGNIDSNSVTTKVLKISNSFLTIDGPVNIPPISVTSNIKVNNLNSNYLEGYDSNYFATNETVTNILNDVNIIKSSPNTTVYKGTTALTTGNEQTELNSYCTTNNITLANGIIIKDTNTNNIWIYNLSKTVWEYYYNSSLIANATLSGKGIVQLSNKYNGTSTSKAVTEKALNDGLSTIIDGSTISKGIVQLSNIYDGDSTIKAVTEKALNDGLTKRSYEELTTENKLIIDAINEINEASTIIWRF